MNNQKTQFIFRGFPVFEQALTLSNPSVREQNISQAIIRETKGFLKWVRKENAQEMTINEIFAHYEQTSLASEIVVNGYLSLDAVRIYLRFISTKEEIINSTSIIDSRNPNSFFRFMETSEWQSLWEAAYREYEKNNEAISLVTPVCIILMSIFGLSIDSIASLKLCDLQINHEKDNSATVTCLGNKIVLPSNHTIVESIEKYLGHSLNIYNQQAENDASETSLEIAWFLTTPRGKYSSSWLWRLVTQCGDIAGIGRLHSLIFRMTFFRARFIDSTYFQDILDSMNRSTAQNKKTQSLPANFYSLRQLEKNAQRASF